MKKNYIFNLLTICLLWLSGQTIYAQSIEDFETEAPGSPTFTDGSQTFTISSTLGENYNVFSQGHDDNANNSSDNCIGCGWNGFAADNQFIDNTDIANTNGDNNGTSFTITTGGAEIGVTSLFLFCSTRQIAAHSGSLTITGYKGGVMQYTFTKTNGFSNVSTFSPNNGYTFIDFATEGSTDFTQYRIDELVFTGTGNLDYLALDAFSWAPGNTLSVEDATLASQINVYPNPASEFIRISEANTFINYSIYDILGNKMKEGELTENTLIDIRNFASGTYLVHFENGVIKKFIKK